MSVTADQVVSILDVTASCAAFIALIRAGELKNYWSLGALIAVRMLPDLSGYVAKNLTHSHLISRHTGYQSYFYVYWLCFAIEAALSLGVIVSIFRLAMKPLKGLERLGTLMFRWAAVMSIALAFSIGLTTRVATVHPLISVVSQLQRFSDVLILCLLVFVCFAIRPMGLTFRSRMFGVSFGLGITASVQLVCAALLWNKPSFDSALNSGMEVAELCTLAIWIVYFALPEPKARIIVLPTTSPYLRWNQISEALGDEPGFVAVAGVPPEVFSPAEVEIMFRASAKMRPLFDEPFVSGAGPEPSITSLTA